MADELPAETIEELERRLELTDDDGADLVPVETLHGLIAAWKDLADERAKVAELEARVTDTRTETALRDYADGLANERDSLRATLATVQAERDGLHAFLREHGGHLLGAASYTATGIESEMPGHALARDALSALLATLPKGTKES